jgi:hypothetical protein
MESSTEDQLTLFAEDSLAKTCQAQESKRVSAAKDQDYTGKCLELLASVDRNMQFLKMSQGCFLENQGDGLLSFSMTWPRSGTMRNGTVYLLHTLAHRITATEFGLLPTPRSRMTGSASRNRLADKNPNLETVLARVKFLPTPTLSDAKGSPKSRNYLNNKSNLCEVLRTSPEDSIYPNPPFVEQMMGFPVGWTDLDG